MKSNRYLIIALVMLIGGAILLFPVRYLQPYTSWQQAYEGREVFILSKNTQNSSK